MIVDDGLPTRAGTTDGMVYTTYLFGPGAFGMGLRRWTATPLQGGIGTEGVEMARVPLDSDTVLINRRRYILHPRGVKFTARAWRAIRRRMRNWKPARTGCAFLRTRTSAIVAVTHNN